MHEHMYHNYSVMRTVRSQNGRVLQSKNLRTYLKIRPGKKKLHTSRTRVFSKHTKSKFLTQSGLWILVFSSNLVLAQAAEIVHTVRSSWCVVDSLNTIGTQMQMVWSHSSFFSPPNYTCFCVICEQLRWASILFVSLTARTNQCHEIAFLMAPLFLLKYGKWIGRRVHFGCVACKMWRPRPHVMRNFIIVTFNANVNNFCFTWFSETRKFDLGCTKCQLAFC